jgi:hypothetical protein
VNAVIDPVVPKLNLGRIVEVGRGFNWANGGAKQDGSRNRSSEGRPTYDQAV